MTIRAHRQPRIAQTVRLMPTVRQTVMYAMQSTRTAWIATTTEKRPLSSLPSPAAPRYWR